MILPAPSIDQVLEAKMREAQEQENLAREMARLAPEEESETDDRLAKTKVLEKYQGRSAQQRRCDKNAGGGRSGPCPGDPEDCSCGRGTEGGNWGVCSAGAGL